MVSMLRLNLVSPPLSESMEPTYDPERDLDTDPEYQEWCDALRDNAVAYMDGTETGE